MSKDFRRTALGLILAIMGAAASVVPGYAQKVPDEQSLKIAHETLISSIKEANLVVLQPMIHPRGLGFFRESQFPVEIRNDYSAADALPALVNDISRFVAVPTDTVYRVFGQAGLVLMTAQLQTKKGEKQPPRYLRGTYLYIPEGGNWRLVSWHGSDTPLAKK